MQSKKSAWGKLLKSLVCKECLPQCSRTGEGCVSPAVVHVMGFSFILFTKLFFLNVSGRLGVSIHETCFFTLCQHWRSKRCILCDYMVPVWVSQDGIHKQKQTHTCTWDALMFWNWLCQTFFFFAPYQLERKNHLATVTTLHLLTVVFHHSLINCFGHDPLGLSLM